MFDGKVGARRVDFSGKRVNKADTRIVLEESRRAREQRAADRLRTSAALRVQALFRGYRSRRSTFQGLRQAYDQRISDILALQRMLAGRPISLPVQALEALLLQMNSFYHPKQDLKRLDALLPLVTAALTVRAQDPVPVPGPAYRVAKYLSLCIASLSQDKDRHRVLAQLLQVLGDQLTVTVPAWHVVPAWQVMPAWQALWVAWAPQLAQRIAQLVQQAVPLGPLGQLLAGMMPSVGGQVQQRVLQELFAIADLHTQGLQEVLCYGQRTPLLYLAGTPEEVATRMHNYLRCFGADGHWMTALTAWIPTVTAGMRGTKDELMKCVEAFGYLKANGYLEAFGYFNHRNTPQEVPAAAALIRLRGALLHADTVTALLGVGTTEEVAAVLGVLLVCAGPVALPTSSEVLRRVHVLYVSSTSEEVHLLYVLMQLHLLRGATDAAVQAIYTSEEVAALLSRFRDYLLQHPPNSTPSVAQQQTYEGLRTVCGCAFTIPLINEWLRRWERWSSLPLHLLSPTPLSAYGLLLQHTPGLVPLEARLARFRDSLLSRKRDYEQTYPNPYQHAVRLLIRREHLLEDALAGLRGVDLRHKVQIEFIREGIPEAGIDGGGLFKEFLDLVSLQLTAEQRLFTVNSQHMLLPAVPPPAGCEEVFHLLGRLVGKAVYEGVLMDALFSPLFLQHLLGSADEGVQEDDMVYYDPVTQRSLQTLREMALSADVSEQQIEALELSFEISSGDTSIPLLPSAPIPRVTKASLPQYVHLYCTTLLGRLMAPQAAAFALGLQQLLPREQIQLFSPRELGVVISGEEGINLLDLFQHTVYHGYDPQEPYVQAFWEVLREMDGEDLKRVLRFVTSIPRAPLQALGGFGSLTPKVCIQKVSPYPALPLEYCSPAYLAEYRALHPEESPRLPSAATCLNLLKLPCYEGIGGKAMLRERLLYAVRSNSGFELS